MKLKLLILMLTLTTLVSCGSIPTGATLTALEPLIIPESLKVLEHEWKCLAKPKIERVKCSAFQKLGKRDNLRKAREQTLLNKIKATHD